MNVICLQIGAGPVIRIVRLVSPSYETAWWPFPNVFLCCFIYQLGCSPGFCHILLI